MRLHAPLALFAARIILSYVTGMKIHARTAALAAVLALAGCAPSIRHFGGAVAGDPRASFVMAPGNDAAAIAAVHDALVSAGRIETADATQRIEVGFAVRPSRLALTVPDGAGGNTTVSPEAEAPPSFCHRQAYVLTVAMIDRTTGAVVRRTGAITSRCHGAPATVLPLLAKAALASQT